MSSISVRFHSFSSLIRFSMIISRVSTVVGLDGFEPSTSRLSGARSNHLSYKPFSFGFDSLPSGGDDGNRTHDPLLAGQVLSQLSYTPLEGLPLLSVCPLAERIPSRRAFLSSKIFSDP